MKETIRAARQKSNAKAPLYAKIPASRGRFAAHAADLPTSIPKNRRLLPTLSRRAGEKTQRPAQDKSRTSCFPASPRETAGFLPTLSRRCRRKERSASHRARRGTKAAPCVFRHRPVKTPASSRRSRGAQAKKHSARRRTKTAPRVFQLHPVKPPDYSPDTLTTHRRRNTAPGAGQKPHLVFSGIPRETAGFLPTLSRRCR